MKMCRNYAPGAYLKAYYAPAAHIMLQQHKTNMLQGHFECTLLQEHALEHFKYALGAFSTQNITPGPYTHMLLEYMLLEQILG